MWQKASGDSVAMSVLKAALIGRSLKHSISPEVHSRLFPILCPGLGSQYDAIDYTKVECETESDVRDWTRTAVKDGYRGANITIPFKKIASQLGQDSSGVVSRIRSANTLVFNNMTHGYSTDGQGFLNALGKECPEINVSNYHLMVLGAGGAARAVVHAICDMNWRKISIAARSTEKARSAMIGYPNIESIELNGMHRASGNYFIINATPVGQMNNEHPLEQFEWHSRDIAADLVYNPLRTSFLQSAEAAHATVIDGLGMLIEQAALSQYIWITGKEAQASPLTLQDYQLLRSQLTPLLEKSSKF